MRPHCAHSPLPPHSAPHRAPVRNMIAVLYQLNVESDNPDKWQQAAQACVACSKGERE